ncbi:MULTISPECIES: LysR substrate-binding domain-containing protein [Photobacterium]|jgi:DNA-binding transcriptional LysR family regulator|uniref:HTH-type transcriptional regulator DmlR n=2 Tax=Photobacterium TaxID=657 RepID=A0A1T5HZT6_9GAMM|nr:MULTISPECIES: LysR substrate-binding domain-containing protein [Photobacterium]KJG14771.1 LysR family transcriptional regulator [Photobacterium iliopiscarium]KJG21176.1 LysR family transcriptional regulator [Photobacterium iliopiscarium]MCD9468385.1 LysR family transcriptional regulator [Photobacterium iliopiscarium]MCD9488348.1 LysR family transcriptional regulator [Photobacterium iliopiscarium]MCF2245111.1 LysR family transcriptional regulator [Photobacterium iliopiscarium]
MFLWEGVTEFVAVAETESFTAASKRLGISTAQVSRQVSALENRLNTKLFYRTTRKVSLTEEGNVYYQHCRQVLDGLEDAERAISNLRGKPQGLIKLTAPVTYGEKYIMPLVNDFMLQYPEVEVTIDLTNRQVDLVEGSFDLAIRLGRLTSSSMMAKRLTSRTMYVCASPAYLQKFGIPHSLSELRQHNCLIGNYDHWRFQESGKEKSIRVSGTLNCNSGYGLRDAVIKGIGLAQLPDYYIDKDLESGAIVPILTNYQEPDEGIWALYPHNRHLSPKVRMLVDYLAEQLPHISHYDL